MSPFAAKTDAPGPARSRGSSRAGTAFGLLLVALAAWLLFANAARSGALFSRAPAGYYGLLTAGFRAGHLAVAVTPHPGLLALKDPYDPVANAPYRVHDMTFYRGKYYLYFGATPALILFWPLAAATGWYPSEPCAVAAFALGGLVAALALLRAVGRRHFPAAPAWAPAAGALVLVGANPILALSVAARFYEVPIAGACCLHLLMLGAVYRALHSPRRAVPWIAAASLLFGLTVGARPNYVLGGVALLVPGLALLRSGRGPAFAGAVLAALAGPAAFCGGALLLYNAQRFGSPFEFGMRYQLAGETFVHLHPFSLAHLRPNGLLYLWAPGFWQRYFPFFSPMTGEPFGLLRYLPWCWLAAFAWLPPARGEAGGRAALVATILVSFLANLGLLSCFFGTTDRYPPDFAPDALLLAGIGALALAARFPSRWLAVPLLGAAVVSVGVNLSALASHYPDADRMLPLARIADWPAAGLERVRGAQFGALRLELQLPEGRVGTTEPIFQTGHASGRSDWLQITYLDASHAKLGFFHAGLGLVEGRPFAVPADRRIVVEARCGSLLPPYGHPLFSGWTPEDYRTASRELTVRVDGTAVIETALGCYASAPPDLRIGQRGWPGDGVADQFSGRILSWRRLPLGPPPPAIPPVAGPGPVELRLLFPADRPDGQEPLLATGRGLAGDLLYCIHEGPGRIRLAFDHSDSGGPWGDILPCDPSRPHLLQVSMGALAEPGAPGAPPRHRVFVRLDGAIALDEEARFNFAPPATATVGSNPFASRVIAESFSGRILRLGAAVDFAGPPAPAAAGAYGAVSLSVLFPAQALGTAEPLVVTGVTGAGDQVSVQYEDATHVRFRLDHWATAGFLSPAIPLDYARPHRLEITLGSLYPPVPAGPWQRQVRVTLDGAVVLEKTSASYPSEPREIEIGKNLIGGSTCGPAFTGRILRVERTPPP